MNLRFAVEFNYGMQAGHADDRYYYNQSGRVEDSFLDSTAITQGDQFLGIKDEYLKIDIGLKSNKNAEIWRMPVETISLSEAGFERVYQSSCLMYLFKVSLKDKWSVRLNQNVSSL